MARLRAVAVGVALILGALPAVAEEPENDAVVGAGAQLAAVALTDQHGETHASDAALRAILFSRDMDGGGVIRALLDPEALGEPPTAFLDRHGAVCVADIHRMPGLIRRATATWPSQEGHATLIRLDGLRVVEVLHTRLPAALREAFPAP